MRKLSPPIPAHLPHSSENNEFGRQNPAKGPPRYAGRTAQRPVAHPLRALIVLFSAKPALYKVGFPRHSDPVFRPNDIALGPIRQGFFSPAVFFSPAQVPVSHGRRGVQSDGDLELLLGA